MATYIIGDIQGCYAALRKLLDKVAFRPGHDRLIAVGDLIARGEDSLRTLRFLHQLGDSFETVLGNHDLHFLAVHAGIRTAKSNDNLAPLLAAKDAKQLAEWLRSKPLALRIDKHTLIAHAGLYPGWTFKSALTYSDEISHRLQSQDYRLMLENMYGNDMIPWQNDLSGELRSRFIINAFTRMRYLTACGALEFDTKTPPRQAPAHLLPWFRHPHCVIKPQQRVIFGHWAALLGNTHSPQFVGLDTGYVWGHSLTLLHLESNKRIGIRAQQ